MFYKLRRSQIQPERREDEGKVPPQTLLKGEERAKAFAVLAAWPQLDLSFALP